MIITDMPIEVYWRALDLYGVPRGATPATCRALLDRAEGSKDVHPDHPGIAPLAQAVAEYMSLSGAFGEDGGEFAGVSGYSIASVRGPTALV